jgi:4-amino-4-deoxy-L-arabinose transferase-like glycosyltransferase
MQRRLVWKVVAILLLAFAIRGIVATSGLPFVEGVDEPLTYQLGNDMRGKLDAGYRKQWLAGYPPAYLWTAAAVMYVTDQLGTLNIYTQEGVFVGVLRILNVLTDLITVSLLFITVYWLAGWQPALCAGLVWAISPAVVRNVTPALGDTLATMFGALCVALSVRAAQRRNAWLALAATVGGLVAILCKYPWVPVLALPAVAFLLIWVCSKQHQEWFRLHIRLPALLALMAVAAVSCWLVFIFGAFRLNNDEAAESRLFLFQNLTSFTRWRATLYALGNSIGTAFIVLGLLAFLIWVSRRAWKMRSLYQLLIAGLLLTGIALLALVPIYTVNSVVARTQAITRYLLPADLMFIILGILAIYRVFIVGMSSRWRWVTLLVPVLWFVPASARQVADFSRPTTFTVAQRWFEQNLPDQSLYWAGGYLSYRLVDRFDAGYPGFKHFYAILGDPDGTSRPSEPVNYIVALDSEIERRRFTEVWNPEQITLIKQFDNAAMHGAKIFVYLPYVLPHPSSLTFKDQTTLLVVQGLQVWLNSGRLMLDSLWQAPKSVPLQDYSFFVHLMPAEGSLTLLAQRDGQLGARPTSTWDDSTELVPGGIGALTLPSLRPGDYVVTFGVYDWRTGRRLVLPDGQTSYRLLSFSIF